MNKPIYRRSQINLNSSLIRSWHLDGFIRVKRYPNSYVSKWCGDTVGDDILLGRTIKRNVFLDSEWDIVLGSLSEAGFGLEAAYEGVENV